jgi:hypothetical protein
LQFADSNKPSSLIRDRSTANLGTFWSFPIFRAIGRYTASFSHSDRVQPPCSLMVAARPKRRIARTTWDRSACNPITAGYFLSRQTLVPRRKPGIALWREHLFTAMARNAETSMSFFKLPVHRVVELGSQIEI